MHPRHSPALRALVLVVFLLGTVVASSAQLSVSLLPDGLSAFGGAALAAASLGLQVSTEATPVNRDEVNGFDRLAMFGYSEGLDTASDFVQYAALALPLALALGVSQDQAFATGVIYFEVVTRAFFAKNMVKFLVHRVRPWAYSDPDPASLPPNLERNDSFPSGHTTMAFAAAAFGVTVAVLDLPSGSPWLVPFAVTEVGLAAITGSLRVFSGMHFMTDVVAGAVLGAAIGIALPLLHTSWTGGSVGKSVPAIRLEVPIAAFAL
jgi:membrane-associated phospholipid phosphatase